MQSSNLDIMKSINPNGRPKLPEMQVKSKVIAARFSLLEYENIKKRAAEAGLKISQYATQSTLKAKVVPRITPEDACVLRNLSKLSYNVNQLAKKANTSGYFAAGIEATQLYAALKNIITKLSNDWKNK
jgi:hypothetical protein